MLNVRDAEIIDAQGRPVRLRGGCVGGWLEKGPPKTDLQKSIHHLAVMAERAIRDPDIDHPSNRLFLGQALPAGYFAGLMQPAFAKRFKGLSESRIDEVMQSFAFRNCRVRKDLVEVLKKYWNEQ